MMLGPTLAGPPPDSLVARVRSSGCEPLLLRQPDAAPPELPPLRQALFGWSPEKTGGPPPFMIHLIHSLAWAWTEAVAEELERDPADLVAADYFLPGAAIAAEAAGRPAALLIHTIYRRPRPGRIPPGAGFRPAKSPIDWAHHAIQRWLLVRLYQRNALPGLNAARKRVGLAELAVPFEQDDRAARVLVLSPKAFDFNSGPLPPNVRLTGYPNDEGTDQPSWTPPWSTDDARPLVVLSPSTTTQAQEQIPFVKQALGALGGMPVRGLLTVGPNADPAAFEAPDNVAVEPYVPHAAVLPQASAIISHCGHGTVMTALSFGVPVICVPFGRDQYDIAARVVWHGTGVEVSKDASAEQIGPAIQRVLSERAFTGSAKRMAAALSREDGAENAANELEAVVAEHRP